MKRLIPLLLFLLFVQTADARMNAYIAGSVASAGCSNNAATDYVGDKVETEETGTLNANTMYCLLYTPTMTCTTGTFSYAKLRTPGSDDATKVCVYEEGEADTAPGSGDTLVGCASVTISGAGWHTSAAEISEAVSSSKSYWVCTIPSVVIDLSRLQTGASDTVHSKAVTNSYTSPPSTLDDSGWTTATRDYPVHVLIK